MANLNNAFDIFHDRIVLTAHRKTALGTARNVVRECIRRYFRDTLKVQVPEFRSQGAYAADTTVDRIEGRYHIEDGVYIQHLDMQDSSNWPAAAAVHQWLMNAIEDHPMEKSMDKATCVRARYGGRYCVDLHCYAVLNGQCRQAVRGKTNWPAGNPIAFTEWFKSYVNLHGEQLRRVVRYLKAWADFQSRSRGKMPGGSILSVLAAYNFNSHKRDDLAFAKTLEAISNNVRAIVYVPNPVNITDELSARLTETQKTRFQEAVETSEISAKAAILFKDVHEASRLWRKLFGDRFPLTEKN